MSDKKYGLKEIAVDLIKGGVEYTDQKEQQRRLDICQNCPKLNKTLVQCTECGCFMKAKVKFKLSKCPLGKW